MRRLALSTCAVVAAAVVVVGVVRASAPPGQYAQFLQTDKCIEDQQTMLTWSRASLFYNNQGSFTFDEASSQCAAALGLGDGWRAPTVNELLTLVDENPHPERDGNQVVPKAIDANAFPSTPTASPYWTSSASATNPNDGWAVDFHDGSTLLESHTQGLFVRCVTVTGQHLPTYCQ